MCPDPNEHADATGETSNTRATAAVLSVAVKDLDLSVRAQNVLAAAEIRYLADLLQWTEPWLLSLQNCGTKTVDELRVTLAAFGLHFGMEIGQWTPPAPRIVPLRQEAKLLADLREGQRTVLCIRTDEIDFSRRASNILATAGIEFVGDLAQLTEKHLRKLNGCGSTVISEIKAKLDELGLHLDLGISDWSSSTGRTTRVSHERDVRSAITRFRRSRLIIPGASCLEQELASAVKAVANARDSEIVIKYLGWSGLGRRTLESVGSEYNVTRERIRQIVARTMRKLRKNELETPWLEKALGMIDILCPAKSTTLGEALQSATVSEHYFDLTGLESACEAFGKTFGLVKCHIGQAQFFVRQGSEDKIVQFFRIVRRLTSSGGCTNFDAVCDELRISEEERGNVRRIAASDGLGEWLDEDKCWIFAPGLTRNRLSNLVMKVLGVCPNLNLSELRRAVAKSRRLTTVPPVTVLARFLQREGLATVNGNRVEAAPGTASGIEPGSTEDMMISVLQNNGPALAYDRFRELCIAAGMNPITFGIYASVSPVVVRLARGTYSLVGADVPPGLVEDIGRETAAARKPAEWGWSARGTLWCAIRLTRTVIVSGAVAAPAFVGNYTEGDWEVRFASTVLEGAIKSRNHFIWGLKRPLTYAGAEPEDVCVLEFNVVGRIVDLTVGGEDLIDAWESGDIELPGIEGPETEEDSA